MNNLRRIRELYGITQEEIATAINVNRATISNWETQDKKRASDSNLEKLSLFYGIGPEFFYDQKLIPTVCEMLIDNGKRQREIEATSNGERMKSTEFHNMFSSITFEAAIQRYMTATKLLLAAADDGDLETLEIASKINKKMGARLDSIIALKKTELEDDDVSLSDLYKSLQKK